MNEEEKNPSNLLNEIDSEKVRKLYFEGTWNRIIRHYYYLQSVLQLFNEFKYLVGGILAIYLYKDWGGSLGILAAFGTFIIALPLLDVAGYIWIHYARKTIEFVGLKFATHFNQYNIRMQEKQIVLLEEINRGIKKLNEEKDVITRRQTNLV